MSVELSVIIPAYNEEDEIADTLVKISKFLKNKKILHEILVVDDGSTDNTAKVIRSLQRKNKTIQVILNKDNIGKGGAIKRGVLAAKGKYILFIDVDLSAPIEQYLLFRKYLEDGIEVVFGSRYLKQSRVKISQPFHRRILGKGFYFLVRNFILRDVKDTNCGFKVYTRHAASIIFKKQTLSGWGFDIELLLIAKKSNLKIKEVPIEWRDSSYSKVKIIPAIIGTLLELIKLKINDIKGIYDYDSDYREAKRAIFKLYGGIGWPSIFTRIRFFTAPYKRLVNYIPTDGRIIDLGSGYGIFSNLLALMSSKRKVIAVELDKTKAKQTNRGLSNVELLIADITKIKIPPVDCILLIHVLHHLSSYAEQETLLKESFKKLKKKGILLIVEIDRFPVWKYILTHIADHILYPKDKIYYRFRNDLIRLLKRYKFKIIDVTFNAGTPFSHVLYICRRGNKNK